MYLTEQLTEILRRNINCSGSTEQEIIAAENKYNLTFPRAYKDFLTICGKDNGDLFCGDVITLKNFDYINNEGKENYKEAFGKDCSEDTIFILEHQGYSFYYFINGPEANPDLFLLVNGDELLHEKFGKFSDLLEKEVKNVT